jgi:Glycosyl transferases group 1
VTRIFGWSADAGTSFWRMCLPFGELAKRGHDVMVDDRMPACVQRGEVDVLVASRTAKPGPSQTFQRLAREAKMLCVYETDDDTFSITPDNRPAKAFFDADILANVRANLACAHLVTTSTPHLAEVLSAYTSAQVVVLPNRVPRWLTELPAPWEREPDPLVVGHTGGASHVRDFGECAKSLRSWLQRQGGRAEFHAIGYDSTARVATIRGRARHTGWTTDVDAYLRGIDFGVGLAPLRDTEFARSKSALKAMEYGALGIPVIASAVSPYDGYVRHGETGFLCSTARDWRDALDALTDPDVRHRMGLAGRLQACGHLIEGHAHEWLGDYERAMSGRVAA